MTMDGTMDDGKGQQSDRRHDNGAGRHDDGDGRHDDGRHDDGKGQQGNRRHNDGDGQHDEQPFYQTRLVEKRLMIELDFYIYVFSMELRSFEKPYVA
jgi:hypothetical protein